MGSEASHHEASRKSWCPNRSNVQPFQVAPSSDVILGAGATLVVVNEGVLTFNAAVEALADESWARKKAEKPEMFDGPVWSLSAYSETAGSSEITLHVCSTSYRYKMLQRDVARSPEKTCDCEVSSLLNAVNSIGVGGMVVTTDGKICLGKRSYATPVAPGMWCYPGGVLDIPDTHTHLKRELHEELGLTAEHICSTEFLGIWNCGELHGWIPAVFYGVSLTVTAQRIQEELWPEASDKGEHTALAFIDAADSVGELARLETETGAKIMPLCRAVIERYSTALLTWAQEA